MRTWALRPIEEANLLNPAFCCVTLTSSIVGYMSVDASGMPYPLLFMILPVVLHKTTRESLPRSTRTSLPMWIKNNSSARLLFYERAVSLKPHTREALLFGLLRNWLELSAEGAVKTSMKVSDVNRFVDALDGDAKDCTRRARLVGKWFASGGSPQTVMALWGICP